MAESRGGGVLVEELIDGPELTVNAVSCDGEFFALTVTDRILAEPPAFGVALAHAGRARTRRTPWSRRPGLPSRALGIENGPSYTQIRLGPGGRPYVVEVAARLGGGHDAELCRAATGIDLNDLALSFALGADPCDKVSQGLAPRRGWTGGRVGGACVLFLVAPEGVLRADRRGSRRPRRSRASSGCGPTGSPGWRFGPLRRGADRAGAVLATGDDTAAARRAGSPCGAGRTLPGRCARLVAPSSASSLPRSGRRRSPPSSRRCARAG